MKVPRSVLYTITYALPTTISKLLDNLGMHFVKQTEEILS